MPTYGIDLGTTYSCVAQIDDVGRPAIVKNSQGDDTTPSVVFFESADNIIVGSVAKGSAVMNPDRVVSLIKRQMGEDVEFTFDGVKHQPETISALILKELARSAEETTHESVKDVVITVPAYFGVREREATRNAGRIAGLNVLNVVPEPVAAALHYNVLNVGGDSTILVYDLGGGTFDTTAIRLTGGDVNVVCTDGDHRLGGADWDERIADYLLEQFTSEHPDSGASGDEEFLQELANASETLKKRLSTAERATYTLRFAGAVTKVELTRTNFEQRTGELLERAFQITDRTRKVAAEKGVDHFDEVLLVGGSTRMPAVALGLRERFGYEPRMHDPDLAVAKGAALFALIESVKVTLPDGAAPGPPAVRDEKSVEEVADRLGVSTDQVKRLAGQRVTTVVPRAFGVKVHHKGHPDSDADNMIVDHILLANTALPASPPSQRYATLYDGQTDIDVEIWEQAGAVQSACLADNSPIGDGVIANLPPLPAGSPIDVTFEMDEIGTLGVHAIELSTRKDLRMKLQIKGMDTAEVAAAQATLARYTVGQE